MSRSMPAVVTHMDCAFCYEEISRKTSRRHKRTGCSAVQREVLQRNTTLQQMLNPNMTAAPPGPGGAESSVEKTRPLPLNPPLVQVLHTNLNHPWNLRTNMRATTPRRLPQTTSRTRSRLSFVTHPGTRTFDTTLVGLGRQDRLTRTSYLARHYKTPMSL